MIRTSLFAAFASLALSFAFTASVRADDWEDYRDRLRDIREEQRERYEDWLEDQREAREDYYDRIRDQQRRLERRGSYTVPPYYSYPTWNSYRRWLPIYSGPQLAPYYYPSDYRAGGFSLRGPFGGGISIRW